MKNPQISATKNNLRKLTRLLKEILPKERTKKIRFLKYKKFFLEQLKNFVEFLQEFDRKLNSKSKIDKKIALRLFFNQVDKILLIANALEKNIDSLIFKKSVKDLFRRCVAPWTSKSSIVRRAFEKPRGYAGDYFTIEMFYNQKFGLDNIGSFCDYCILKNELAYADIHRKDKMVELLKNFILNNELRDLKIMNLGCGGCKDLRDLFTSFSPKNNKVEIIAVDQDSEALSYAKKFINRFPKNVRISFQQKDIVDLLRKTRNSERKLPARNLDLVYSIGLVDYFSDNVLQLFVRFCLKALGKKGQLIIAHKNRRKWRSFLASDWFCDWRFYQRNKEEVLKIIKPEIKRCKLKIKWEKTQHMFFLIITKDY